MKKVKHFGSTYKKISPFIKPYRFSFLVAIFFVITSAILNSIDPRIEGMITTQLAKDAINIYKGVEGASVNFTYILRIMGILAAIYLVKAILNYGAGCLLANAIQSSIRDLRTAVESKIRRLPISYFDKNSLGDVLSRVSNDIDTISNAFQQSFIQIVNGILVFSLAIGMMFTINVKMALFTLLIIPLSYFISRFIVKKSQTQFNDQQDALGVLNGKVQEMYTGFNEIKLYGKEEDVIEEFKEANNNLRNYGFKAQFISSLMNPLISLLTYFGIVAVSFVGSLNVISGSLSIGNLQAFIRYIWQINQPLSQVTQLSTIIQSAYSAINRVLEILEEEEMTEDAQTNEDVSKLQGNVSIEHVQFGYKDDNLLITDLNAEVKSGQMVAIVGPTGAGKTTLINLLMRFYDVKGGAIKIDGIDIRDLPREDLRSLFGMVLQDTWLFSGSIYENIEYGRFGATKEEIVEAAKRANVHHFIKTLPDGYNMLINEEGSNISIGEKQLLTIARAFLSNPSILILDEATSSVDTRLEIMLQEAMKNIMKGRTSFVIAHRLSTIRNADLILVMNQGSIIEQGTHDELIAKGGFYENLYNSQFAGKSDESKLDNK
ncbi:ABC transporter ATP-binding protein [Metaclostridioides mangenotii]|uniref:ABC transporter ATP-binding protein n=1 Tax=Metaclostridioides mangenotii TaxID=1540 RepID=UPI0026EC1842|nr:ABC transporter ATP-binding protein [Clostridioides mangenotii]